MRLGSIAGLCGALQGEGEWADGPEEGGVARCYGARCCAELAGDGGMHQALLESGLADALAERAAAMVSLGLNSLMINHSQIIKA